MKGWLVWIGVCALVEAAVVVFATAAAVHSARFASHSVGVAALIMFGIEIVFTAICVIFANWEEGEE